MEIYNNKNRMDELLVKHLLGETLPEEKEQVEKWISASADNRRHFQQFKTIWESSRQAFTHTAPDEADAWQRFREKVHTNSVSRPSQKTFPLRRRRLLTMAAVIACLVISGGMLYILLQPAHTTVYSKNKVITRTLPDGSLVTLNKNAILTYTSQFNKGTRTVQLKGEAFFEVVSQSGHPFIIRANNITVKVLGTSFNINTSSHSTEVIVETGRVEVRHQKQIVQLTAHQKAVISSKENRIEKQQVAGELYNYYKTKTFICKETPLKELVAALNETYPRHIRITDRRLNALLLTATFHDQPLDTILSVIKQTFDQVVVVHRKDQILLKYKEP